MLNLVELEAFRIPTTVSPASVLKSRTQPLSTRHGAETHSQPEPATRAKAARGLDRERDAQPPQRHITGEAAIRAANEANRQIGALKAIEGPHKRYPRP